MDNFESIKKISELNKNIENLKIEIEEKDKEIEYLKKKDEMIQKLLLVTEKFSSLLDSDAEISINSVMKLVNAINKFNIVYTSIKFEQKPIEDNKQVITKPLDIQKEKQVTPIYLKTTVSVEEAAKITGLRKDVLRTLGYNHPELADYYGNPTKRRPKIKFKLAKLQEFINNTSISINSTGNGGCVLTLKEINNHTKEN